MGSRLDFSRRRLLGGAIGIAGAAAWMHPRDTAAQAQPRTLPASVEAKAPPLPALGTTLRLPSLGMLDGSHFEPARAEGKLLVVYWWASWCPFCAVQSPEIEKLWRTQQTRGLQVLALSVDTRREDAIAHLNKKSYTFPAAMMTPDASKILPKPKGLPVTLVRGRDGKLLLAEAGQMFPEDIEDIAKFL